jgi:hypothetical protein
MHKSQQQITRLWRNREPWLNERNKTSLLKPTQKKQRSRNNETTNLKQSFLQNSMNYKRIQYTVKQNQGNNK